MPHSAAKCVALPAACIFCFMAADAVFADRVGVPEGCGRIVVKALTERPRMERPEAGAVCTLTDNSDSFSMPDRAGRRSDTLHFLSYQGVSVAILYALPESFTGWTDEQKESYSLSQWWDNVQNPEWDTDDFFLNYVAHPYWGAAYFVRSRERGFGELDSFLYSAALSASYEFGAEALFENPSIQDLIVTPVGGWLVGRYFMTVREGILADYGDSGELPFGRRAVLAMTDPLGAINRSIDRWLGLDQRFTIQPFVVTQAVRRPIQDGALQSVESEQVYGFTFTYVW